MHHLAETGNVRASASRVGLTHQSAYLVRRRERPFKAAWDAALVLAREVAAQVLATQAIDGIEEPVWFRGQRVGMKKRYDSRLLLAHIARLDKAAEAEDAALHAERFDELLAAVAGEGAQGDMRGHGETWADPDPLLPHPREPWADKAASRAYNDACEQWREDLKARRATKADEPDACFTPWFAEALAEWDAWHARACATVDAAVEAESREVFPDWVEVVDEAEEWGCEDERDEWGRVPDWNDPVYRKDPPVEYKSWDMAMAGLTRRRADAEKNREGGARAEAQSRGDVVFAAEPPCPSDRAFDGFEEPGREACDAELPPCASAPLRAPASSFFLRVSAPPRETVLQDPLLKGEVAAAPAADGGVSPLVECSDEGVTPLHHSLRERSPSPCRGGSDVSQDTGNCGNSAGPELPRELPGDPPAERLGAVARRPAARAGGGEAALAQQAVEGARVGFGEAPLRTPGDRERDRRLGSVAHEMGRHHRHVDRLAGSYREFAAAG
ncbi:hypothetical protein HNO88_003060 [Novosphingobium chloroacetimidivorans]|uniref:Uncharacterized protein n=1 Tax=Novosphingobium chloroacetimidivorans TaxID=1428314 RepID=A0A7W7NWV0_9SPHN|nr:hypothetical protein [Novosphingobium chloroacetimidivorans]